MSKEELNCKKYLNDDKTSEIWIHVELIGET